MAATQQQDITWHNTTINRDDQTISRISTARHYQQLPTGNGLQPTEATNIQIAFIEKSHNALESLYTFLLPNNFKQQCKDHNMIPKRTTSRTKMTNPTWVYLRPEHSTQATASETKSPTGIKWNQAALWPSMTIFYKIWMESESHPVNLVASKPNWAIVTIGWKLSSNLYQYTLGSICLRVFACFLLYRQIPNALCMQMADQRTKQLEHTISNKIKELHSLNLESLWTW